jgi:hypothetical protein
VRRLMPISVPKDPCSVDAAIVKVEPGVRWDYNNEVDGRVPAGSRDLFHPPPDDLVAIMKCGAASGLTKGLLDPGAADHRVYGVPARYTCGWFGWGDEYQFAKEGDSGAVVLDGEHFVLGMAVAIEAPQIQEDRTVGCYIHGIRQICRALRVDLL